MERVRVAGRGVEIVANAVEGDAAGGGDVRIGERACVAQGVQRATVRLGPFAGGQVQDSGLAGGQTGEIRDRGGSEVGELREWPVGAGVAGDDREAGPGGALVRGVQGAGGKVVELVVPESEG